MQSLTAAEVDKALSTFNTMHNAWNDHNEDGLYGVWAERLIDGDLVFLPLIKLELVEYDTTGYQRKVIFKIGSQYFQKTGTNNSYGIDESWGEFGEWSWGERFVWDGPLVEVMPVEKKVTTYEVRG